MSNFTFKPLLFCAALAGITSTTLKAQNISFAAASNEEAEKLGVKGSDGVPLFIDFDNNGFMDIFATGQTFEWLPTDQTNEDGSVKWDWKWYDGNFLALNNGDGTFTTKDRNAGTGLPVTYGGLGSKAIDFNQDGYTDFLFLSCQRGWTGVAQTRLILVKNNGDGTFTEVADEAIAGLHLDDKDYRPNGGQSLNCMSIADYNKDGYPDILIQFEGNNPWERAVKLLKNVNGDHFELVENTGIIPQCGGSVSFGDFNNDGWPDIVVTGWADQNESIGLNEGGNQMHFYRNKKDGTFELASKDINEDLATAGKKWGFGDDAVMFVLDYDQDGKQDILCIGGVGGDIKGDKEGSQNGKRSILLRNVSTDDKFAFEEYETNIFPGSGENTRLAELADFNGDGWVDYVSYGWNGDWITSASSSKGTYDQFDINTQLNGLVMKEGYMTHGDINNDGLLDIATLNSNDRIGYTQNTTEAATVQKPGVPTDLKVEYNEATQQVNVTWTGSQTESGSKAFYNLYIKNETTGQTFMLAPADAETGFQRAYTSFSAYVPSTNYTFENIESGNYTVGVQAVTYSWQASEFATASFGSVQYTEIPASTDPIEGKVEELGIITLFGSSKFAVVNGTHDDDGNIANEALNCEVPYIINKNTQEKTDVTMITYGEGYNEIQLWFLNPETFEPITDAGNYELVIPQGFYCCPDNKDDWQNFVISGPMNQETRFNYTIKDEGDNINAIFGQKKNVNVYTIGGILVEENADREVLKTLKKGLYIINGKSVLIK